MRRATLLEPTGSLGPHREVLRRLEALVVNAPDLAWIRVLACRAHPSRGACSPLPVVLQTPHGPLARRTVDLSVATVVTVLVGEPLPRFELAVVDAPLFSRVRLHAGVTYPGAGPRGCLSSELSRRPPASTRYTLVLTSRRLVLFAPTVLTPLGSIRLLLLRATCPFLESSTADTPPLTGIRVPTGSTDDRWPSFGRARVSPGSRRWLVRASPELFGGLHLAA